MAAQEMRGELFCNQSAQPWTRKTETYGLFDGDFAKGIHREFDIGQVDARLARIDAYFHRIVNHSLLLHDTFDEK